jgi:hypothetical protein
MNLHRAVLLVMAAALALVAAARLHVLPLININWDEFYFFSRVLELQRDALTDANLTFHARAFFWLDGHDEIAAIVTMRRVMAVLAVVTAAASGVIAKRWSGSTIAALFAVVVTQTMSALVWHGTSARFDPLVVCCFMLAAAAVVVHSGVVGLVVAAVFMALALLFSLKAALFVPPLLLVVLLQRRAPLKSIVQFVVVGAVCFASGMLWHSSGLSSSSTVPSVQTANGGPLQWVLKVFSSGVIPRAATLAASLKHDPLLWLLVIAAVVAAVVLAVRARRRGEVDRDLLAALALASPLAAVLVYRNAYIYFFVSVVPPLTPLLACVVARALRRRERVTSLVLVAVVAFLSVRVASHAWQQRNEVKDQRTTLAVVHQVFPAPVPYVDICSMVGRFQKVGPFLSTWSLENYRADHHAVFVDVVRQEQPQFLLTNGTALELDSPKLPLLPTDAAALRNNFVKVWGPLWVAGHDVDVTAGTVTFVNEIAGDYRSSTSIVLDDVDYPANTVVHLDRGPHTVRVAADSSERRVRLTTTKAQLLAQWPAAPTRRLFRKQQRGLFER